MLSVEKEVFSEMQKLIFVERKQILNSQFSILNYNL